MQKVRIKDIAEIANVSMGTVDRVIHNRGEVSQSTRTRIQKLLEEYNYKPDIIARSLAQKRQVHLGVVMPALVNDHAFWRLPGTGIQKALNELSHYKISIHTFCFDQFNREDFRGCVRNFPYAEVDGVLFAPVFQEESTAFLRKCEREGVPVVLFNSQIEGPSVRSFVGQDAFQSGYVAARLIHYGMGSTGDVAIINMSARTDHYEHIIDRERGFRRYFEEHSIQQNRIVTVDLNGVNEREFRGKLDRTFRHLDIAGLFVTNSRVYKVAEYLVERGITDVRLVGYDLLPESIAYLNREYIDFLISQKPDEQAFRGLTSLFNLVFFNQPPEKHQWLPIDIITRENLDYYQK